MKKMSYVKRSIITAVCIALCVVLPMAFHSIKNAGNIFAPMHIPVLLCGLICGAPFGLLCGIAGPILSSLFTAMPPIAILPAMAVELAAYGLFTGLFMSIVRTKKLFLDLYVSLIAAQICGRVLAGIAKALIFSAGSYSVTVWATSYFVTSLPGIAIQLALVPSIVYALQKARLVTVRLPAAKK